MWALYAFGPTFDQVDSLEFHATTFGFPAGFGEFFMDDATIVAASIPDPILEPSRQGVLGLASVGLRRALRSRSRPGAAAILGPSIDGECMLEHTEQGPPRDWARIGLWLVAGTLAYNVVEAVLALWLGAEAESIALLGFGLDSGIEVAAASVLLWRLALEARGVGGERLERAEHRVHQVVGVTFLALALYVTGQAGWTLAVREAPQASPFGIALATASLLIMPAIAVGKLRAAREIGSAARIDETSGFLRSDKTRCDNDPGGSGLTGPSAESSGACRARAPS